MLLQKNKLICLLLCVHIALTAGAKKYKDYKNFKYYDVKGSEEGLENLKNILQEDGDKLLYVTSRRSTEVVVAPELNMKFREIAALEKLNATLLYNDISKVIQLEKASPLRKSKKCITWDAYYDVDDIYRYLTKMSKTYSKFTEPIVGGKSYEGRPIRGLRINTPTRNGETKPVFFIESGIHAREWIAPATTTYFINQLLTSADPNVTRLRDQFDWRIFPTVNPDGYHYSHTFDRMWRKTRSISSNGCIGADPNRNWDYNWGKESTSHDPCHYQLYCGSQPFSEVETRTLSSYISKIDNLLFYVSFHSAAAILLLPLSDSTEHVDNYDDLIQIGNASLEYGSKVNNVRYDSIGTAAEILYPASGGSMDWVRHTFETPLAYTYELRGSSFHWPPRRIPEQGNEVVQMILGLATEAKKLKYY
ncbi:zinc carboxypeptidase-like [Pararge aegeria]|uniref:Jg1795 protein n=1 Tax=Pararge aegeria aegeria TaxID=348720 RepID=A0A8S4RQ71_9NEOP|nr:zinc carboxypeptidase-like [Pararge aegeria]CAH2240238.1 jg1795 [Pararge aegeria aegeria]